MLYRTLSEEAFRSLINMLLETDEVVGPTLVGHDADGRPQHQFLPVHAFEELAFDSEVTEYSAKTYFLPFRENLSTFTFDDERWEQSISYRLQPRALVGLRACDINALLKLDRVFLHGRFPSPYYASRRRNTFVIGLDHEPCTGGFCYELGCDTVTHGFDLFLTDLGDAYFVAIDTDRAFQLGQRAGFREPTQTDVQRYVEERRRIRAGFVEKVSFHNVHNLLDIEFESPVWRKWGQACLSCGGCAMVCPTCYCYGVTEEIDLDLRRSRKVKHLHSCNLVDFAMVAGGHNFRPDRGQRLKYRYYHQHRGFLEGHDVPQCVGCNRCGRACPSRINPVDVISDLQEEQRS